MAMTTLTLLVFIIPFLPSTLSMLYNKLSYNQQLKTTHSFVSLFLWITIPGTAELGLQDFAHAYNQDVSCLISSHDGEELTSRITWLLAKFSSLLTTDQRC